MRPSLPALAATASPRVAKQVRRGSLHRDSQHHHPVEQPAYNGEKMLVSSLFLLPHDHVIHFILIGVCRVRQEASPQHDTRPIFDPVRSQCVESISSQSLLSL